MNWTCVYRDSGGNWVTTQGAGSRTASTAVNAIRFLFSSGNVETGVFKLYGLS
jgi:hypothetical protein